jgi:hypothetical protein
MKNLPKILPTFDEEPWLVAHRWPTVMPQPGAPLLPGKWAVLMIWEDDERCVWFWTN